MKRENSMRIAVGVATLTLVCISCSSPQPSPETVSVPTNERSADGAVPTIDADMAATILLRHADGRATDEELEQVRHYLETTSADSKSE
jgi:hypothetical protein